MGEAKEGEAKELEAKELESTEFLSLILHSGADWLGRRGKGEKAISSSANQATTNSAIDTQDDFILHFGYMV